MRPPPYVLVTAARNEAAVIERTLASVVGQTLPPAAWAVVSDGSTDGTDDLVARVAARHSFVQLVRVERDGPPSFAAKVDAIRAGYRFVAAVHHEFVGNLDADIELPPRYYEDLLSRLAARPRLGIAGGAVLERVGGADRRRRASRRSVAGAVQLFRRSCWEAVGGYPAFEGGGEDAAVEVLARAHGFEVETVPGLEVVHHGRVLSGAGSVLRARAARGRANYRLGYHPVFQLASAAYRTTERPYVVGGLALLAGYAGAAWRRTPAVLPPELVLRLRREQLARLAVGRRSHSVAARAVSVTELGRRAEAGPQGEGDGFERRVDVELQHEAPGVGADRVGG
jgi:GT2 family glycosyltransferase